MAVQLQDEVKASSAAEQEAILDDIHKVRVKVVVSMSRG